MTLKEIAPWRWGGLRRWEDEGRPFESFFREMSSVRRDIDHLFDDLLKGGGRHFMTTTPGETTFSTPWSQTDLMPRIDETEDDNAFYVHVELPGMDKDDVDITLSNGMLTIRGEKKREDEVKGSDYYRKERSFGAFRRTVPIPAEVDESAIDASFKKGVLYIELPKSEAARKQIKHIDVKAA